MVSKSITTFYLDSQVKHSLDLRKIEDKTFNPSELVNNYLKSYFDLDSTDYDNQQKEIKQLEEKLRKMNDLLKVKKVALKTKIKEDEDIGEELND